MDEKRVSITDNISSVTITHTTAEKLQNKQPVVNKDSPKRDTGTPTDSEVQSMTVDQTVYATARYQAEQIATNLFRSQADDPNAELSPEARVKLRSTANRLIVINDDKTVTVHNNVTQANKARKAQREAARTNRSKVTPE